MDDIDQRMIALLRFDARAPISTLAGKLGVSRATVRARIDRLVSDGTIQGFTIRVAAEATDATVRAITLIEIEGRAADRIRKALRGFPEIVALHTTNGRFDFVAELQARSLAAFDSLLGRIRQVEGITATETHILLASDYPGAAA
ncbi:MAG TPA: Lrp/AsnC family transcriptional regulator [Devosiaceae bacterium]